MPKSYLMLFPAQETAIGRVPAHLFSVRTDAERFDALAEGATDVTGHPDFESRWDQPCADLDFESGPALAEHPFH
jgi:hypothetical protein